MAQLKASQVEKFDVAVIGAGPAGAIAAAKLAAANVRVVLIEKHSLPRYKTCGGGLLGGAVKLAEIDLSSVVEHRCSEAIFKLSPELSFTVLRSKPIVTMTMRDKLDMLLVQHAVSRGAIVRDGCRLNQVRIEKDGAVMETSHGSIRADHVIAADGAGGIVAKACGWPEFSASAVAVEYEVQVHDRDLARFNNIARFDFDAVPHGYGWVFPKSDHLSIGVGTLRGATRDVKKFADEYIRTLGIEPLDVQRHGFVIPISPRSEFLAKPRVMLTGDAAGLADPITAEGIGNAIRSASLAADAIVSQSNPHAACEMYNAKLHDEIFPELKWARRLGWILYDATKFRDALFRRIGQRLTERMTDIVTGDKTYVQTMRHLPSYLRLLRVPFISRANSFGEIVKV